VTKKRRIVPCFNKEGRVDGYVVHPDDRDVREVSQPRAKFTAKKRSNKR
jgi:hypothetical protein